MISVAFTKHCVYMLENRRYELDIQEFSHYALETINGQ